MQCGFKVSKHRNSHLIDIIELAVLKSDHYISIVRILLSCTILIGVAVIALFSIIQSLPVCGMVWRGKAPPVSGGSAGGGHCDES